MMNSRLVLGQIALVGLLTCFASQAIAQPVNAQTRGEDLVEVVPSTEFAAQSSAVTSVSSSNFRLLMIESGTSAWTAIRLDTRSGKSWIVGNGNIWKPIQEPQDVNLTPSKYVVRATRFAGSKYALIRMDSESGRTWFMKNDRWLPMPVFEQ